MSRRGNCFDNAPIESFWGTLNSELVYHRRFATRQQAQYEITEYMRSFVTGSGHKRGLTICLPPRSRSVST
ncbi:integrase core domain-containing protein [Paraburkholderia sp. SIMBA_055]